MGTLHSFMEHVSNEWPLLKHGNQKAGYCHGCGTVYDQNKRKKDNSDWTQSFNIHETHHTAELYGVLLGRSSSQNDTGSTVSNVTGTRSSVDLPLTTMSTAPSTLHLLSTQLDIPTDIGLPQRITGPSKSSHLLANLLRHVDFRKNFRRSPGLRHNFFSTSDVNNQHYQQRPTNLPDNTCVQLEGCHIPGCLFVEHGNLVFQAINRPHRLPMMLTSHLKASNHTATPGDRQTADRNFCSGDSRTTSEAPNFLVYQSRTQSQSSLTTLHRQNACNSILPSPTSCSVCCPLENGKSCCCLPTAAATNNFHPDSRSSATVTPSTSDLNSNHTTSTLPKLSSVSRASVGGSSCALDRPDCFLGNSWQPSLQTISADCASASKRHPPPPLRLSWPLVTLRCFAFYNDSCLFKLEAGRRAPRGEGHYLFRVQELGEFRNYLERYVHRRRSKPLIVAPHVPSLVPYGAVSSKCRFLPKQHLDEAEEEEEDGIDQVRPRPPKTFPGRFKEDLITAPPKTMENLSGLQPGDMETSGCRLGTNDYDLSPGPSSNHRRQLLHDHHHICHQTTEALPCFTQLPLDEDYPNGVEKSYRFTNADQEAEICALPDPPPIPFCTDVREQSDASGNVYDNVDHDGYLQRQCPNIFHRGRSNSAYYRNPLLRLDLPSTLAGQPSYTNRRSPTPGTFTDMSALQNTDGEIEPGTPLGRRQQLTPPPVSMASGSQGSGNSGEVCYNHRHHHRHLHHHLHHHYHHHPRHASLPIPLLSEDDLLLSAAARNTDTGCPPSQRVWAAAFGTVSSEVNDSMIVNNDDQAIENENTSPYYNLIGIKPPLHFRRIQSLEHTPHITRHRNSSKVSINNTTSGNTGENLNSLWHRRPRSSQALFHADNMTPVTRSSSSTNDPARLPIPLGSSPRNQPAATPCSLDASCFDRTGRGSGLHYATLDFTSLSGDQYSPSPIDPQDLPPDITQLPDHQYSSPSIQPNIPTGSEEINCSLRVYGTLVNDIDLANSAVISEFTSSGSNARVSGEESDLPANYVAICQLQTLAMRAVLNATT